MTALKVYKNGYVPRIHLRKIQGTLLRTRAKAAFNAAAENALLDRVHLQILPIRNQAAGYRPRWVAIDLRIHPGLYDVDPRVRLAPAAEDSHGQGTCFDVTPASRAWLLSHGAKYGIHHPIPGDENHFEYRP